MKTILFRISFPALLILGIVTQPTIGAIAQTASGPTITRPGSLEDSGPLGYWSQLTEQERAGGVLLGKIAVQGEPFLWSPIPIIVSCDGKIKNVTDTDTKGNFLIRAIIPSATPTLQEDQKRRLENEYEGCIVEASLAGFHSSTTTITHRHLSDDPDIGRIILQREDNAAGTAISATTRLAPTKAVKSFQKARSELMQQNPVGAKQNLEKAVQIYPAFAEAWYELGRLQESTDPQSAMTSLSRALAADPQFVPPFLQLAGLAAQEQKWQKVVDNTGRSLHLDPAGSPQIWYYDALGHSQMGDLDAAQASAMKALALDPQHRLPNTEQMLAGILIRKGSFTEARAHLDQSLAYVPAGPEADLLRRQIAHLDQVLATKK